MSRKQLDTMIGNNYNEKSIAKYHMSLPKMGHVRSGLGNLNCEENYFPILDQIIPSMTKQI